MRPALQKNEAFLSDVRRALADKSRKLWWLGQSGFLLVNRGRALVLDPYLSDSLTHKYANTDRPHTRITERVVDPAALGALGVIDAVTSSHNHTDHLDPESLQPLLASNPKAKLLIPAANRSFALERLGPDVERRLVEMDAGTSTSVSGIEFHGIPAAHSAVEHDSAGRCKFLGYIIQWGNLSVYHSGDTMWHDGLVGALQPFTIDIALLPINGDRPERRVAGNLNGPQAAKLAHDVHARTVIPCHFDLFEFNTASPADFIAECQHLGQPFTLLRNGQGLEV